MKQVVELVDTKEMAQSPCIETRAFGLALECKRLVEAVPNIK